MPTLLQDLRYAVRQLHRSPGFAITAILTLAIGVGANVVIFSVLNALTLKPLNVPHPRNLYNIFRKTRDGTHRHTRTRWITANVIPPSTASLAIIRQAGIRRGTLIIKSSLRAAKMKA